ncbi:hypothetical protein [Helicobacter pylori]|nr:hypothetical protein [Helicobacter pylori]
MEKKNNETAKVKGLTQMALTDSQKKLLKSILKIKERCNHLKAC